MSALLARDLNVWNMDSSPPGFLTLFCLKLTIFL
jgi:hypothetical protein